MADFNSAVFVPTIFLVAGLQDASSATWQSVSAGFVTHYSLGAIAVIDGLRRYWTSRQADLSAAPVVAGGYVGGSLTVLGSWQAG
jgi:hypothetical protein